MGIVIRRVFWPGFIQAIYSKEERVVKAGISRKQFGLDAIKSKWSNLPLIGVLEVFSILILQKMESQIFLHDACECKGFCHDLYWS